MKNKTSIACGVLALGWMFSAGVVGCDAGSAPPSQEEATGSGNGSGTTGSTGSGDTTSSGTTGSTGSGNMDVTILAADMIDDLDDGDAVIKGSDGRKGAWYTYNDGSMTCEQTPAGDVNFEPVEGGPEGSVYTAKTNGSGCSDWGAGLGFDLNNEGDPMGGPGIKKIYDATGFKGVAFHAKGNAAGANAITVKMLVEGIVPAAEGGSCGDMEMCNDAHGKAIGLSGEYKQYVVYFDDVFQGGWGKAADFDPAKLMGIQFQVAAGATFDFEIDQIGFF